jgi:uroporphyrinogen III methyltransferase/synthase
MSGSDADDRPLAGRRILVTRRPDQASSLADGLRRLGAVVLEIPAIEVAPPEDSSPLDEALRGLDRYRWLLFTSANAVRAVRDRLSALGLEPDPARRGVRVASVGSSTSEAYATSFGGTVDLQPASDFRAEGLIEAFVPIDVTGRRLLLPTSDRARDVLPQALRGRGAVVDVVVAYRTVSPPGLAERLGEHLVAGVHLATFASSSAVESFVSAAGDRARGLPAAVIGPVTEKTARAAGFDVQVVASPSTAEGLIAAIVSRCRRQGR